MATWLQARMTKKPFIIWSPKEVVCQILSRASRDQSLDYEQAFSIGRKAAEKYSGNWEHTLRTALPYQAAQWSQKGCRMNKGDWGEGWILEQEYQKRVQEQQAKLLLLLTDAALDECKRSERPYSSVGGLKTFWQYSYFERLDALSSWELFFSSEVDDREEEVDFSRVSYCSSCAKVGGPKKIRYYGWGKGFLCLPCWNRSKPIWKAEQEYREIKTLINKLDRGRLEWQRSQKLAN